MNDFAAFTTIGTTHDGTTIATGADHDPMRSFLRARTAAAHARLDAKFELRGEAGAVHSYHRFILMNLVAHRGLSEFLSTISDADAAPLKRRVETNRRHLENDGAAMRIACPGAAAFALEACERAEMAGLAYVLDGSKFGARFIYRSLEKAGALGQPTDVSTQFLQAAFAHGPIDPTPAEIGADAPRAKQRALQAALASFALFEDSLDRVVAHEGVKETPR